MFRPFAFVGVASAAIIESRPHEHLQMANAQLQNATDAVIKTAAVAGLAYAGAYMAGLEAGMTTSGSSYDSSRKSQESSTGARYCNTHEENPLNYRCTAEYFNGKTRTTTAADGTETVRAIHDYWCCPASDIGSQFQGKMDGICVPGQLPNTGTDARPCTYQGPCNANPSVLDNPADDGGGNCAANPFRYVGAIGEDGQTESGWGIHGGGNSDFGFGAAGSISGFTTAATGTTGVLDMQGRVSNTASITDGGAANYPIGGGYQSVKFGPSSAAVPCTGANLPLTDCAAGTVGGVAGGVGYAAVCCALPTASQPTGAVWAPVDGGLAATPMPISFCVKPATAVSPIAGDGTCPTASDGTVYDPYRHVQQI